MSVNTIPPDGAIPLVHDFCPSDRPYPDSYQAALDRDPARCVALDPCSGDGVTTLWTLQPCETTTTVVVEVGTPPTLPATGVDISEGTWGVGLLIVGAVLLASSKWRRT